MKRVLPSVIGVVLAMALSAMAIRVCNRCGYEVNEGVASCSHCGAAMVTNVVSVTASGDRDPGSISADLVEKEIQEGLQQREKGDAEVAAALFCNALALEQVVPDSGDAKRGERIRGLLQASGVKGTMVQGQCLVCGGSGKTTFNASVLDGKTTSVPSSVSCRACNGTGKAMRPGTASEAIAARSGALKRYAALQQSRKYVAVGGAWVPVSIETNLTVRQISLLKRTAAMPCQACMGTGVEECPECKGSGRQLCSKRCNKGIVTEKPKDVLKGTDLGLTRKVKCRTCGGTGFENCSQCFGRGQIACQACSGKGERPVCGSCDGAGTQTCAKCSGNGKIKGGKGGVCVACKGSGVALCASCKGDGRKR